MFHEQPINNIVFNDIDKDILEELTSEYNDDDDYDIDAEFSALGQLS